MKKRIIELIVLILLLTGCNDTKIEEKEEYNQPVVKENIYSKLYIEKINELSKIAANNELTYSLIYINTDDIPELIAAKNEYYINIYTIINNEVIELVSEWPYGAYGNSGYEYIEKENIIRNYNSDYAGLIVYTNYYKIGNEGKIESYYGNSLAEYYFNDINNNNIPDEGEYDETSITLSKYLYGSKEISEDDYSNYIIDGNYKFIKGVKTRQEMIDILEKNK